MTIGFVTDALTRVVMILIVLLCVGLGIAGDRRALDILGALALITLAARISVIVHNVWSMRADARRARCASKCACGCGRTSLGTQEMDRCKGACECGCKRQCGWHERHGGECGA